MRERRTGRLATPSLIRRYAPYEDVAPYEKRRMPSAEGGSGGLKPPSDEGGVTEGDGGIGKNNGGYYAN